MLRSIVSVCVLCTFIMSGVVAATESATAPEPLTWMPFGGNPIFTNFTQSFDAFRVGTVMKGNGLYKLWGGQGHIQYSTSSDGVTWSLPIFLPGLGPGFSGDFDQTSLFGASVIYNQTLNLYQMWYTGQMQSNFSDFRIGYATSSDGISWTKVPGPGTGGCVIDKESVGTGEGEKVQQPVVLFEGSVYKMWYHGSDPPGSNRSGIFYAESSDGVNWTKVGKVIDRGPSGAFDFGGTYPRTIIAGEEYRLWYEIDNDQSVIHHTAYATSTDGINWTKHGLIPFPDEPWCMSESSACTPQFFHVVENGSTLEVWYQRSAEGTADIGNATSFLGGHLFDDFRYDCVGDCEGEMVKDDMFGETLWDGEGQTFLQFFWNSDATEGEREILDANGDGILALRLPAGFADAGAGSEMTPRVASPIRYNAGTYAARVAFDGGTDVDNVVQTFWAQSPISCDLLFAEIDFEYYSRDFQLDYVTWETGGDDCRDSEFKSESLALAGGFDLIMRVEPEQAISFEVYDSASGQRMGDGWDLSGHSHLPERGSRMGIFFNIWLVPDGEMISLTQEHGFLVDWVVHIPGNAEASWAQVTSLVHHLRSAGVLRKDTTAFFSDGFESGDLRYWVSP